MSVGRSLQWLRGSNKNVELELDTIRSNIRTSRFNMDNNINSNLSSISHNGLPMKYSFKSIVTNVKSVLKNARLVKPVLITCGLMIFQRFTGEYMRLQHMPFSGSNDDESFIFFLSHAIRRKFLRVLCCQNLPSDVLRNEPTRRVRLWLSIILVSISPAQTFFVFHPQGRCCRFCAVASITAFRLVNWYCWSHTASHYKQCFYVACFGQLRLLCTLWREQWCGRKQRLDSFALRLDLHDCVLARFALLIIIFSSRKDVLMSLLIVTGISPISWLLIGELFPLEYRGIGSSIATSFSYFCAFLAVKTFVDFQVSLLENLSGQ